MCDQEKYQIVIFEKLETAYIWHFYLKKDWNSYLIIKIVAVSVDCLIS